MIEYTESEKEEIQRKALIRIGTFVLLKIGIFAAIHFAARALREES